MVYGPVGPNPRRNWIAYGKRLFVHKIIIINNLFNFPTLQMCTLLHNIM